jgi:hypothetical protein
MRWLIALFLMASMLQLGGHVAVAQDPCASPVASASPTPEGDPCAWFDLVAGIDAFLQESGSERFAIDAAGAPIDSKYLPDGWIDGATWHAELPAGGGAHWASLLRYASPETLADFRIAYELTLKTEFFEPATVRSLTGTDACFTLWREESSRAICLFERGHDLIVAYSFFEIDVVDGLLINALALGRLLDQTVIIGNA